METGMKGVHFWATWALLVVLPMHARCAELEAAPGTLTAVEAEQCQAQVNEFNERVRTYNARVGEIKALRAEIELRRAELDKDTAAVDRDDPAAMEALNARINNNNELIERHGQATAVIKEMAAENAQRAARFHDACDNRPPAQPAHSAKASGLQTQPSTAACSSVAGAKDLQQRIDAALAEMREDEKRRQAEVSGVAEARAKAQSWSKQRQSQVWLQVIASPVQGLRAREAAVCARVDAHRHQPTEERSGGVPADPAHWRDAAVHQGHQRARVRVHGG
jgi:chromosome segregation ATPase